MLSDKLEPFPDCQLRIPSGREKLTSLGEISGAAFLEVLAAVEVAFLVEACTRA